MDFQSDISDYGIVVVFKGRSYLISYPKEVWESTPRDTQVALRDNLVLATTMHLPLVFNESEATYNSGRPLLEPYFTQNFLKDIPSCTEVDGTDTADAVRRFFNTNYRFLNPEIVLPSKQPVDSPHRAIVGLSFGKDSLLTYALADEIGLDPHAVFIVEESMTYEEKHKKALGEKFKKEFGKDLLILHHDTGRFRNYDHLGLPFSEFGWGLQTTEYALELIPFAYANNAKYLLFGNEQTASATYMDAEGKWLVYPCYDQSHEWTVQIDQITQMFSGGSIRTGSLIEPLMDMMVQRILAHRYPHYAKYQMSCFTEKESGRDYHWCHDCTICAKMYLLCVGGGIEPSAIGIRQNMFSASNRHFFTLFGGKSALTYANTEMARNEQLFAFLSAVNKGAKGDLIDEFKSSDLYQEALDREDELFKKFTHIYEPITVPRELKNEVLSIFREEVSSFTL
ncbi:MAG: hypothetical protein AM324_008605 [Candidatus Thorarchaeota archaeon SMTZ1-83]|nr:MAG: hypothetical protein AM324_09930 [Candidatus Thorarchaeota archaeon SMTZ1-83]